MGFKCGIVGLPNVGKSSLFNALTKAGAESANYPFTTIEPNVGIVSVPDDRLDAIAKLAQSAQKIPTTVKFVDIAGLIAGAAKGEGLGNQFLANIRETQAIVHVVRCFQDENVVHVHGDVNPLTDIEVINTELALSDLETIEKALGKIARDAKRGDKEAIKLEEILLKAKQYLDAGKLLYGLEADPEFLSALQPYQLLTNKPILYVANVDENNLEGNTLTQSVETYAKQNNAQFVIVSAKLEAEIAELSEAEQKEFLNSLSLDEPGLNKVIRAGYALLGLLTFFTAGPKEARAWTCRQGFSAPEAAGVIHSDFEKGFIRAEVIAYADYIQYKGEQGAKEAGKWRLEGKDYLVQDGDVVLFRFNV